MSLYIASLNSGSNGNCYYVGNDDEAILVDVGLSCKETEKRMTRLGLSMNRVKAVFISHEHSDHIFGLPVLTRKYKLPVYITERTRLNCALALDPQCIHSFNAFEPVGIGSLSVHAFPKLHDAADPHSFIVSSPTENVGIFTDIGDACNNVVDSFVRCNAVFLESNYDEQMLMNGRYPYYLKKRISGGKGHLSNAQAHQLFVSHRSPFLSHLILSHLSKQNNSPEIVNQLFQPSSQQTKVVVASRYQETELMTVTANNRHTSIVPVKRSHVQLRLF